MAILQLGPIATTANHIHDQIVNRWKRLLTDFALDTFRTEVIAFGAASIPSIWAAGKNRCLRRQGINVTIRPARYYGYTALTAFHHVLVALCLFAFRTLPTGDLVEQTQICSPTRRTPLNLKRDDLHLGLALGALCVNHVP